jgi:hypothetical protein
MWAVKHAGEKKKEGHQSGEEKRLRPPISRRGDHLSLADKRSRPQGKIKQPIIRGYRKEKREKTRMRPTIMKRR